MAFQQLGRRSPFAPGSFVPSPTFGLIRNLNVSAIDSICSCPLAVCVVLDGKATSLTESDEHTCYGPHATSLRMSNIGYTNRTEKSGVNVCYKSPLPEYIASLTQATVTPWPPYQRFGVKSTATTASSMPTFCNRKRILHLDVAQAAAARQRKTDRGAATGGWFMSNCVRWTSIRWSHWA